MKAEGRTGFDRWAVWAERALQVVLGVGFAGLVVFVIRLDAWLAPGESVALMRARMIGSALHLLIPLALSAVLTICRVKSRSLTMERGAARAGVLIWLAAYIAAILVAALVGHTVVEGLSDVRFE